MTEQKVVITDNQKEINSWIEDGWKVTNVIAQHVTISSAQTGMDSYGSKKVLGNFCFIIEKAKTK